MSKVVIPKSKEVVVVQPSTPTYNNSVKLQSQMDAHLFYDGQVTQRHYEWERAGAVVAVDAMDAPFLLEKKINRQSCCGGSTINTPVFLVVE